MFRALVDAVERFITDFSARRLWIWGGLLVLLGAVVFGYEWYTNQFRLARLSDQVEVLQGLQEVRREGFRDTVLMGTYEEIRGQLRHSVARTSPFPEISPRWIQALLAAVPWVLFSVLNLTWSEVDVDNRQQAALGLVVFGVVAAVAAWLLPPSWPLVVTHVMIPVGAPFLVWLYSQRGSGETDTPIEASSP